MKKIICQLESRTRYFTCAKNDTSNQKPPQCVSFAPSFPLFMGTVSSLLELLCRPETTGSLRASSPGRFGGMGEKERELATTSLKFEYLHRKSRCEMLIGGDEISNDVITLGKCFSMFVYIRARFPFALIEGISQFSRRGATGDIGDGVYIPET